MSPFLSATIKSSFVLVAALVVTAALRRRSAALRHSILAVALLCASVTPLVERVAPSWRVSWAPWASSVAVARVLEPTERLTATTIDEAGSSQLVAAKGVVAREWLSTALLVRVWLVGAGLGLLLLVIGLIRLARLAVESAPVTRGMWTDAAKEAAEAYGLTGRLRILASNHPTLVATWGILRPKVVLPVAADQWSADCARAVMSHELAHVSRGDWAMQLASDVIRSIYWFNPLVWLTCRRLREESERACDDLVLSLGIDGTSYATHLLNLARAFAVQRSSWTPPVPAPGIVRSSSLEGRIVAMLNAHIRRNRLTRSAALAVITTAIVATVALGGLGVSAQETFAQMSGTISDQNWRPVSGVALVLSNAQTQIKYEVKTDKAGQYQLVGLSSGDYALEARAAGFMTAKEKFTLTGQDVRHNIALPIGMVEETITVVSEKDAVPVAPMSVSSPISAEVRLRYDPAKDRCAQTSEGGCIQAPLMLRHVSPIYPAGPAAAGIDGVITLAATINTDGLITDVTPIQPAQPELAAAAIDAVRLWEYRPTRLDTLPISTPMQVTVNFVSRK